MASKGKNLNKKNNQGIKNSDMAAIKSTSQEVNENGKKDVSIQELYIQDLESRLAKQTEEYSHTERLQKALFSLSELASGAEEINQFYHSLHQTIAQLLNAENFYIALVDEAREKLEFVYFVDSEDVDDSESGQYYAIPLSNKSLSTYLYGLKKSALLNSEDIEALEQDGVINRLGPASCSWLGAPLIANGMVLGIIVVQSYGDGFIYQEWHKELFDYVSNVIATTLERKQAHLQLELKVKERTSELEKEIDLRRQREVTESARLTIADLANSEVSLDTFYEQLHQIISNLIYAENFYIALKDKNSVSIVYYVDSIDKATIEEMTNIPFEEINNSITAYLFRAEKSLLLTGAQVNEMEKQGVIKQHGPEALSWIGVPLVIDGDLIGVVVLQSYREDKIFDEQDKYFLEYISRSVATAIHRKTSNQQLEDLVSQRTKEIELINQQLVDQVVEKTQAERIQSNLYKIAKLASGIEDMPTFYKKLHKILCKLFYANNFYIALFEPDTKDLVLKYHQDERITSDLVAEKHAIRKESLSWYLFRTDKPLLLQSNEAEAFEKREGIIRKGDNSTSWLGVPLRENGHSIGIMVLQSYSQDVVYEPWHLELLEYVSNQIALTLTRKKDRSELEKLVQLRTHNLELEIANRKKSEETQSALYLIANLTNQDLELDEFYSELHKIIGGLVYCENFFIGLKDNDDSVSFVYYKDTVDDYNVESISSIPTEKLRKSLTYFVMKSGQPLLADAEKIEYIVAQENLDLFGEETVSWLGVPLIIDDSVIGVMVIQSYLKERVLTNQDRELMIFVSQHVATALQKNRNKDYLKMQVERRTIELNQTNKELKQLVLETERSEKLQSALYRISDLASSDDSSEKIYANIHEIISGLIYAKNLYIALYNDDKSKLDFVYFVDTKDFLDKETVEQISAKDISHTFTGYVLKSGLSFLKTGDDENQYNEMGIKTIGKIANYWLGVPLKIDSDTIGIIVVQSYDEVNKIGLWEKELLEFVSQHIAIALERKQAHKALEKRVDERTLELANINCSLKEQIAERRRSELIQSALYKISNISYEGMPLNQMFEKIHNIVSELIYCENFYITLWNEEDNEMDWIYFVDSRKEFDYSYVESLPIESRTKTFANFIVKTAQPILADKKKMQGMVKEGHVAVIGPITEYFLGVPLLGADSAIGAMAVQSYEKNIKYSQADQELLKFVSQSIVTAIERREQNIQLEQRVENRTQELIVSNELLQNEIKHRKESEELQKALFEISETPQQCVTEVQLYKRLHEILARMMRVTSLYIALVDNDNRTFNFDYIYDDIDKNVPASIPIGKSLTSYVYRLGKTVHLNNKQLKVLEDSGEIEHLGAYSVDWVGVPLISAGAIYGIMILQSYDENYSYSVHEIDILNFVSTHIAEALQRKNTEKRLRSTYAELAMKTKKAEAASEAKSSFLATVSHEIRTPMNGILGLLSLMSDTSMSKRQRDYVSKISTSANSLLGIINDILDFSKIEQGKLELEHLDFDLLEILDNLVDLFTVRVNERDLNFTIDIAPNVCLSRRGDSLRLSQILINLVGNAIKFTEQGFVKISVAESEKNQLEFEVKDSGIGLAPEQYSKIFGSFTQADDTTTRKFGGSGLGLSICQQLVTMMKGEINVTGELGVGSCFSFSVNIARSNKLSQSVDLCGTSLMLISDNTMQIESWKHFCQRFNLPFISILPNEFINYPSKNINVPKDLSHIFIDEAVQEQLSLKVLETVRVLLNYRTPCFILANPSLNVPELQNLGDDVQFIPKPNKMGLILSLIQHDFDVLQLVSSDSKEKNNIRKRMLGRRVLVAEDNLINQQVAKEILEKSGAEVTLVVNGLLAVDACRDNQFDLILMDMQMPVMDGYQASEKIREEYSKKALPIIAMTANVMKGDREKCLSFGMNDYIAKPIDRTLLFKIIEKFIPMNKNSICITEETHVSQNSNLNAGNSMTKVFDIQELADRFDSMDLAKELVNMFYHGHVNDRQLIKNLIDENRLTEARSVTHKLKGSAGELALTELHEVSASIESTLKREVCPEVDELEHFYKALDSSISVFSQIVNQN
jgi:signal transduction histidine kinase/FixJ family two-component response regulator/putative methionine-R-sulfoxide reductase with GAF domain/HPt (histidine-containing phosphotransfer) domain-containing protein